MSFDLESSKVTLPPRVLCHMQRDQLEVLPVARQPQRELTRLLARRDGGVRVGEPRRRHASRIVRAQLERAHVQPASHVSAVAGVPDGRLFALIAS